jgi:hypothetical protein
MIRQDLLGKYGEAAAYVFGVALALSNWHHTRQNKRCYLAHFSYKDMMRLSRYSRKVVYSALGVLVDTPLLTRCGGSRGHEMSYEVDREDNNGATHNNIKVDLRFLDDMPWKHARHHYLIVATKEAKAENHNTTSDKERKFTSVSSEERKFTSSGRKFTSNSNASLLRTMNASLLRRTQKPSQI